jgi:hypothetical protein
MAGDPTFHDSDRDIGGIGTWHNEDRDTKAWQNEDKYRKAGNQR